MVKVFNMKTLGSDLICEKSIPLREILEVNFARSDMVMWKESGKGKDSFDK